MLSPRTSKPWRTRVSSLTIIMSIPRAVREYGQRKTILKNKTPVPSPKRYFQLQLLFHFIFSYFYLKHPLEEKMYDPSCPHSHLDLKHFCTFQVDSPNKNAAITPSDLRPWGGRLLSKVSRRDDKSETLRCEDLTHFPFFKHRFAILNQFMIIIIHLFLFSFIFNFSLHRN